MHFSRSINRALTFRFRSASKLDLTLRSCWCWVSASCNLRCNTVTESWISPTSWTSWTCAKSLQMKQWYCKITNRIRLRFKNVLALFNAGSMTTRFQSRLSHFQWIRFAVDGLSYQINIAFNVENFLLSSVQMKLNRILRFAHVGRAFIQRIVAIIPVAPNCAIYAINQCFSWTSQLSRWCTNWLRSKIKKIKSICLENPIPSGKNS